MYCVMLKVNVSTVSEKLSDNKPTFKSRSKLINSGGVVSSVKLVTLIACSSPISTTGLSFISTTVKLVILT